MATNQRENRRKAKKNAKNQKIRKTLWIIAIIAVVILLAMKISEINFSRLGDIVTGKDGAGISSVVSDEKKFPINLDTTENTVISAINGKISVLTDESYSVIDASDAEVLMRDEHGYANPVISISGGYSVIADQGSDVYRLDGTTENIYENKADGAILCADVSDTGIVALATVGGVEKSDISVLGKSLNEKMNYSTSGYVTSIAIDNSGKSIAFAVVGSENAKLKTTVYTMAVKDSEPVAQFVYEGSSVLNLHFASDSLYVVGDDFVSVILSLNKEIAVYEQGSISTVSYCYNPSDHLIIGFGEYSGAITNKLSYVKPSGKIKSQADIDSEIKDVTASGTAMTALTSSEIVSFRLSNGKEKERINADDSYLEIRQMSSKIFARHHSVLELING